MKRTNLGIALGSLLVMMCLVGLQTAAVASQDGNHNDNNHNNGNNRKLTISVSPTKSSVATGGKEQLIATVKNTNDKAVTWQVNGVTGGSATAGTISAAGVYTAPAKVPSPASVTVTAVSQAKTSVSASATVTITGATTTPPASVTVSVSPTTASAVTSGTQAFTATVKNTSNTAVTWQVNGVTGGSSSAGTISTSGAYKAPTKVPSPASVTVTAVSQANTSVSASAAVTITSAATTTTPPPPPPAVTVSVSPTSAGVATGSSQDFSATVSNTTNTAVTWQVNGVTGGSSATGTISSLGDYAAPATVPSPATVTVTAISQASTSVSASAVVTVTAAATTGTGSSFYVATTGNDSAAGTISAPWKTIQHAASSVHAGDTVYVRAGTYNESVTIAVSGTASQPVTFQSYPGETATVDGTGLSVAGNDVQGLFNIEDESYVTISGFVIQNYTTSSANSTPAGIWVTGSGSNIQILNNQVHNITTTSEKSGNAFGIAVYGSEAPAAISNITISGNTVYNNKTGNSETVNVDGNVDGFTISNNTIHDNDNIGIDAIGFEGVSPSATYDFARNGKISGNTVYNISAINNPGEGNEYDADGIYIDGGSNIVVERNLTYANDLNIEVASEHSGHYAIDVTVRNNVVYFANSVGISIGGYASSVGGTQNCTIVNNSLFENDTKNTGSGEFQVQYYATGNIFENNIVYANSQGLFVNNYTNSEANPVTIDYNIYFSSLASSSANFLWDGASEAGFAKYQTGSKQDAHSSYTNPDYLSVATPPNLNIQPTSPAVGAGINLGSSIVGTLDYAGNPRLPASIIDIGAYQQ
jgi:Protein of unknown function (DUF1565)